MRRRKFYDTKTTLNQPMSRGLLQLSQSLSMAANSEITTNFLADSKKLKSIKKSLGKCVSLSILSQVKGSRKMKRRKRK